MEAKELTASIKRIVANLKNKGVKVTNQEIRDFLTCGEYKTVTKEDELIIYRHFLKNPLVKNPEPSSEIAEVKNPEPSSEIVESSEPEATALTFSNDFEKAALAQTELKASGLELSVVQSVELVASVGNKFGSKQEFILKVLAKWESLQLEQSQALADMVQERVVNIKTAEIISQNQIKTALMDADKYISDSRDSLVKDLENFVTDIVNRG